MKPIHKGVTLCNTCNLVICVGLTKDLHCEQCMQKMQHLIDIMEKDEELGLYDQEIKLEDIFNDEKRQGVKELIDTHKQRPEKYSERFDNDKSEIGNPDTWGKRVVEEPKPIHEQIIDLCGGEERFKEIAGLKPKQETLEEAVNAFKKTDVYINELKQKQEIMYSEEEVLKLLIYCKNKFGGSGLEDYTYDYEVKEWFEQFKNK